MSDFRSNAKARLPRAYRHASPGEACTRAACAASTCRFPNSTLLYPLLHRQSNVTRHRSLIGLGGLFEVALRIGREQHRSRRRQLYFVQFITMGVFWASAKLCCRWITSVSDGMGTHRRALCAICQGPDPRCPPGTLSREGDRTRLICA